jgi:hypothetical protein
VAPNVARRRRCVTFALSFESGEIQSTSPGELRRGDAADRRLESHPRTHVDRRQGRGPRLRDVRRVEVLRSEERVVGGRRTSRRTRPLDRPSRWPSSCPSHPWPPVSGPDASRLRKPRILAPATPAPAASSGHQYLAARRPSGGRLLSLRAHSLGRKNESLSGDGTLAPKCQHRRYGVTRIS